MPTVAEILQHNLFAGAHVVAGTNGLNREVRWVHNSGVPDASNWVNGGELVLTTAINMPESPEDQQRYLLELAEKDVAGVCITTGRYIEHIPDYLCSVADECGLPLIEIPFHARFVDIAKTFNEVISENNMSTIRDALKIQQTLTQLVLEGGSLKDLAKRLAELLGQSISIESKNFEAIATENISEVDEARRYTQMYGRTAPHLVNALEEHGFLPQIRETLRPVHLKAMPEVGLEMERLLAPIVVHGEIYGFMWIIADDHALSEIDMMAIESGSTIAALMLLYRESVQNAEASLKGTLLSQMIQGDTSREAVLTEQSLRFGVDLRLPYVMMLVENPSLHTQYLSNLYRALNQFVTRNQLESVVGQFAGRIVILAQWNQDETKLAEQFRQQINVLQNGAHNEKSKVWLSVSAVQKGVQSVGVAHQQCLDTLHIAARLDDENEIVYFNDLGYLHALYQAGAESLAGNRYVACLRQLKDETQAELFKTLEIYLDAGASGVQTAEVLHIHRSTLNYRLQRITELCGVDLSDPQTRMNLQVALKLMRLFDAN